jgi:hypothetical protein
MRALLVILAALALSSCRTAEVRTMSGGASGNETWKIPVFGSDTANPKEPCK